MIKIEKCLMGLIFLMPYHYLIFEIVFHKIEVVNLWRDFVIIILFIITTSSSIQIKSDSTFLFIYYLICIISAMISICLYNNIKLSFNLMRIYIIPTLIFFVTRAINPNNNFFIKIEKIFFINGIVISIYGIFQSAFLGDNFLVKIGYPSSNGILTETAFYINGFYGNQRVVGTFVGPNECGTFLGIVFCIICLSQNLSKIQKKIGGTIVFLGLVATFSRSSLLGVCIALLIVNRKKIKPKILLRVIIIFLIGCLIIVWADKYIFKDAFIAMLKRNLLGAITLQDESALAHLNDLIKPIGNIITNPFGYGLGQNGPRAKEFLGVQANTIESSYYLMAFEIGVIGALICFIPYVKFLAISFRAQTIQKTRWIISSGIVIIITFIFLPSIQTFEYAFYFFFFYGLLTNNKGSNFKTLR